MQNNFNNQKTQRSISNRQSLNEEYSQDLSNSENYYHYNRESKWGYNQSTVTKGNRYFTYNSKYDSNDDKFYSHNYSYSNGGNKKRAHGNHRYSVQAYRNNNGQKNLNKGKSNKLNFLN